MKCPCRRKLLARIAANGEETMLEQVTWQELAPVVDPLWRSVEKGEDLLKIEDPVESPQWISF